MVAFTDFEKEFAERTRANLQLFEDIAKTTENNYYEVTQFINSLLGMLVFIQEATNTILEKEINEYQGSGTIEWLHGQRINPKWRTSERNPNQMEYVIYHMRNAIAHCGIKPYPEEGEIEGFIFTDSKKINNEKIPYWRLSLPLPTIRIIADELVQKVLNE